MNCEREECHGGRWKKVERRKTCDFRVFKIVNRSVPARASRSFLPFAPISHLTSCAHRRLSGLVRTMTSLSLPPPRKTVVAEKPTVASKPVRMAPEPRKVPSYEERCRAAAEAATKSPPPALFVPRSLQDFGDGGAYPEIHVAQYPRHMGNPHVKRGASSAGAQSTSRAIVNVQVDKEGEISYDAIVKGGTNKDKLVYSKLEDMKGGAANPEDVALPTEAEEQAEAERLRNALNGFLATKKAEDKPKGSALINAATSHNQAEKTQFIQYTPRPDAPGYNPAAAQRVIQMVPAQVDPFMPPKHMHRKAPAGPAEDPVPVLHAPPTKLTAEERAQWNIPACISNWKNSRGYNIALDKRLAADGRHAREAPTVNDNFATLSESLYVAERQARQEVRLRAQVQKKLALQESEKREEALRELANQARKNRGGEPAPVRTVNEGISDSDDDESVEESEDAVAAEQRERLRMERKREREREMRMDKNVELKKRKLEEERDVSEKIALGVHTGTGGLGGEVDSRLYSQSAGMDSGFGADDEYNTYTKPLFDRQGVASSSIYRPSRGETELNADEQYSNLVKGATSKFQPAKGFTGAAGDVSGTSRTAPVQFEKAPER